MQFSLNKAFQFPAEQINYSWVLGFFGGILQWSGRCSFYRARTASARVGESREGVMGKSFNSLLTSGSHGPAGASPCFHRVKAGCHPVKSPAHHRAT